MRAMTAADAAAVAALSGQLGYPAAAETMAARFDAAARDPHGAILVAEDADGAVRGWVHVVIRHVLEADAFAELAGLVVDEGTRRRGLGRALVGAAEAWARRRGCGRIRVRSNVARDAAHAFYPGLGYREVKTQRVYERVLGAGAEGR